MTDLPFSNDRQRLWIPALGGFYDRFAQPFAWTAFRVAIGGMLVVEGWPKIMAPLAQVGFVENLGFYPGWVWSPFLAALQFFGGFMIAIGLLTRPLALANMVMLAITLWFHFAFPYGHALLTDAGIEALKAGGDFFTPDGVKRLADGGTKFLEQVQTKAELASLFWTGGAGLLAAFGGGYWSIDRLVLKKEF
ncbi:DoxX family protein [Agrobacterium sp. a22-2]|uniref:DoxX family protein n=1 Tax=Agrobacterium sp. a22-2 TaxID=2283840 RepID=UPI001447FFED|nr:DoxX family protein [Agrobacterium sp. a22-2]NKN35589.1 DoxX family protein [Agrobacterium sp. a22-2]